MKVTWGLENATHNPKTVTTLGSYDGIHRGHQHILRRLVETKQERGLDRAVLLTFHPHPQEVLQRNNSSIELLTSIEERLDLISDQGIDEAVVIRFSREFAQTSYIDFFREIIANRLGTKAMVVGFNHAFGKNREGDAAHLKSLAPELGISIEEVAPVIYEGTSISSTKIRNALKSAELANANAWLGYNYAFSGRVIHGDAIGRTLGYPTANLEVNPHKLIPADGVYSATVRVLSAIHGTLGPAYRAALSIGTRPTTHDNGARAIEALLLDFDGNLYDKTITVECLRYLRPQEKYTSLDALKAAIARDVAAL